MMMPCKIFTNKTENPSGNKDIIKNAGTESPAANNKKRPSFLNKSYPVITSIIAGQTRDELISFSGNCESEGAGSIAIYRTGITGTKRTVAAHQKYLY